MVKAFLGIGTNLGERIVYIQTAIEEIEKIKFTKIIKASHVYETEPWGNVKQDNFLNCVVEISTSLKADALLYEIKVIEERMGRAERKKWAEREIDIDLLFYGNETISTDKMKVPHNEIENRRFVLVPMEEIAAEFIHPVFNKTIRELLSLTTDKLSVTKYELQKI